MTNIVPKTVDGETPFVLAAKRKQVEAVKELSLKLDVKTKPKPKPSLSVKINPRAKAVWSYQAGDTDEVSLDTAEIVEILRKDESGWWTGKRSNGETGLFPGSYVQMV